MLVCVFLCSFAHETAGAARTRCSLRPLIGGQGIFWQSSDVSCREIAKLWLRTAAQLETKKHPSSLRTQGPIIPGVSCCQDVCLHAGTISRGVWVPAFAGTTKVIA